MLGVLRVAAALEQASGYATDVMDLSGLGEMEPAIRAYLADHGTADAYGISATMPQMPAAFAITAILRRLAPDATVILGGAHPTLVNAAARNGVTRSIAMRQQMIDAFDVVVAGDGERAIFEALRPGSAGVVDADVPGSNLFLTADQLGETPWPSRHLIDLQSYHCWVDGVPATSVIAQLGCPFRCGFSLTGDTLVFTERGPVPMRELATGVGLAKSCDHGPSMLAYPTNIRVATPGGHGLATEAIAEGLRPVIEVEVEGGLSITATAEHKFLVVQNADVVWRTAGTLSIGDVMVVRAPALPEATDLLPLVPPVLPETPPGGFEPKAHHTMPAVLGEDLAWLAGFVVGDGSIPADDRPSFHVCVTDDVRDKLTSIIAAQFNVTLAVSSASNTDQMDHGWVHSRLAREVLVQSIGIDPHDKFKIPASVWRYTPSNGVAYLVTASKQLADHVAYALLVLGRGCPTLRTVEGARFGKDTVHYRVGTLQNDRIPTTKGLYRSAKSNSWHWRTFRSQRNKGVRRRTLRASGLTHPLDRDGWYYVRVTDLTRPLIQQPVFDITVPGEEAFVANGFVAHNCGGRNSPTFRRVRLRGVDDIVNELTELHTRYGYHAFMFLDDELNVSRSYLDLLRAIAQRQRDLGVEWRLAGLLKSELFTQEQADLMYVAGFRKLLVGFESGDPTMLLNMQKNATRAHNTKAVEMAHRAGLKIKALMSLGHPGESEASIGRPKDWLLEVEPDEFDATVLTVYPGTPYHDEAIETSPGVWTYTAKGGDRVHARSIDQTKDTPYYKGIPGQYQSYVWTDHLTAVDLVQLRDALETDVRARLQIAWPAAVAELNFEHSMGQS
jgi:radical SAM superfamily enzyme YgiQ (UPF0313 family)